MYIYIYTICIVIILHIYIYYDATYLLKYNQQPSKMGVSSGKKTTGYSLEEVPFTELRRFSGHWASCQVDSNSRLAVLLFEYRRSGAQMASCSKFPFQVESCLIDDFGDVRVYWSIPSDHLLVQVWWCFGKTLYIYMKMPWRNWQLTVPSLQQTKYPWHISMEHGPFIEDSSKLVIMRNNVKLPDCIF